MLKVEDLHVKHVTAPLLARRGADGSRNPGTARYSLDELPARGWRPPKKALWVAPFVRLWRHTEAVWFRDVPRR